MLFSWNIIESKPSNEGCNVFQACGRGVTPVERTLLSSMFPETAPIRAFWKGGVVVLIFMEH